MMEQKKVEAPKHGPVDFKKNSYYSETSTIVLRFHHPMATCNSESEQNVLSHSL